MTMKSRGIFVFNELSLLVGELRCVCNSSQSVNEPQRVTKQSHEYSCSYWISVSLVCLRSFKRASFRQYTGFQFTFRLMFEGCRLLMPRIIADRVVLTSTTFVFYFF